MKKIQLDKVLKNSCIKKHLQDLNIENDFEKCVKVSLYTILLDQQINILCDQSHEKFEQIKKAIMEYSPINFKEDSEGIIIKNIQLLNNIIKDDILNRKKNTIF